MKLLLARGSYVALLLLAGAAAFAFFYFVRGGLPTLILSVAPGIVGTLAWVAGGAPLWAPLSWSVPLTILFTVGYLLVPMPWSVAIAVLGFTFFALMLFSSVAARWWMTAVLRR